MEYNAQDMSIREIVQRLEDADPGSEVHLTLSGLLDTYSKGDLVGEVHVLYADIKACKGIDSRHIKANPEVLAREALILEINMLNTELLECTKR